VAVDTAGNVYATGTFEGMTDLDPGPGTYDLTAVNDRDVFVAKLSDNPVGSSITLSGGEDPSEPYVEFMVTFSEPVTGVDASDFRVTTTGTVHAAAVTNVARFYTTYTVTIFTDTGTDTIRLELVEDDSILGEPSEPLGGAGGANGSFGVGDTFGVDKSLPVNWACVMLALALVGSFTVVRHGRARLRG